MFGDNLWIERQFARRGIDRGTDAETADPTEAVSSSEPAIEPSQPAEVESTTTETQMLVVKIPATVTEPSEVSTTTDALDSSDH